MKSLLQFPYCLFTLGCHCLLTESFFKKEILTSRLAFVLLLSIRVTSCSYFHFPFSHQNGIISISEVAAVCPSILNSSFCFSYSGTLHKHYFFKKPQHTILAYSFSNLEQCSCSIFLLTVIS